jgi:hypothetical protein
LLQVARWHHWQVLSSVPSQSPADVLRRIRALAAADPVAGQVTRQHVISKVLLRRLAEQDGPATGMICSFRLRYPHSRQRLLGPDGCGKILDFVAYASGSVEKLWKETEDRLPAALQAVDRDVIFEDQAHVATIKDAIALHFARSKATRIVHYRVWAQTVTDGRKRWMTEWRPLLEDYFYREKGFRAAGNQALEKFLDEVMEFSMSLAGSGALFRERVEDMYRQARIRTGRAALEILAAGQGEFLIGDVPALTVRRDRSEVGTLGGIAMDDAHSVVLPLGPRHAAALGKVNITAELSPGQVDATNALQLRGAIEYVYLRPGSGLQEFARSFADAQQETGRAAPASHNE